MCGWVRAAIACASRRNRSRRRVSAAKSSGTTLQRDVAIEAGVEGAVDIAHAAGADQTPQLVGPQDGAGTEGHGEV